MICIYLYDKLSSKLMEDDQDEMGYLSRLWYIFT